MMRLLLRDETKELLVVLWRSEAVSAPQNLRIDVEKLDLGGGTSNNCHLWAP